MIQNDTNAGPATAEVAKVAPVANVVVVLLDSLNRHMVGALPAATDGGWFMRRRFDIAGEHDMIDLLQAALVEVEAPAEQLARLGLV